MRTGKIRLLLSLLAAAFFLNCSARAVSPDYETGVRSSRTVAVQNEAQRSFQLSYRVWSEDWVCEKAQPSRVILLLEAAACGKGSVKIGIENFLESFRELSPKSQIGIVVFGKACTAVPLTELSDEGVRTLTEAVEGINAEEKAETYSGALQKAQELLKQSGTAEAGSPGTTPVSLVTLTAGDWLEEGDSALTELQVLRSLGVRSYTVSLCSDPGQEEEEFWQSLSSVPLSTHHYLCGDEPENCLSQIQWDIAAVLTVEVTEQLDPRFTLSKSEQLRLSRAGAHLAEEGAWKISWQVSLPRRESSPWEAGVTVLLRESFPGGNDVPLSREGSGLYRAGKEFLSFSPVYANVPLSLELEDYDAELFLGERVKTSYQKKSVEELLLAVPAPDWFGRGKTGDFSYFWETESGGSIGSLRQLNQLQPQHDINYRLRVTYRPDSPGLLGVGEPVPVTERSALYRIKLVSGSLRIRAKTGAGVELDGSSSMKFRLEGNNGILRRCTAKLEADPESGRLFLEGEATNLPYGVYTVFPEAGEFSCAEAVQTCRLGVWERDDTVSPQRKSAKADFTLVPPKSPPGIGTDSPGIQSDVRKPYDA